MNHPRHKGLRKHGASALAVGAASAIVGGSITYGLAYQPQLLAALFYVLVLSACLYTLPAHIIPSVALAGAVAVPLRYLPVPEVVIYTSPFAVLWLRVLCACYAQGRGLGGGAKWPAVLVSLLLGVSLLLTLGSPDLRHGLLWCFALGLGIVVPVIATTLGASVTTLRSTFEILAGGLGAYALVEKVAGSNSLSGALYGDSAQIVQEWSTYRATTLLGHPLVNAVFLSAGAVLAIGSFVSRGEIWKLVVAISAAGGTLATVSRTGLLALGVGTAVTLLLGALRAELRQRVGIVTVGALVMGVVLALSYGDLVFQRGRSSEGAVSSAYRSDVLRLGLDLVERRPMFGSGPGSLTTLSAQSGIGKSGNFENSWLEIALIMGLLGVSLWAGLFAMAIRSAMARADVGAAGGLIALAVSASGFNFLAGYPPLLLVVGSLMAIAIGSSTYAVSRRDCPPPSHGATYGGAWKGDSR